jgi:hypothetical protein
MGMKSIWESILIFLEAFGRARTATALSRAGKHEEARKLMEADFEVHP